MFDVLRRRFCPSLRCNVVGPTYTTQPAGAYDQQTLKGISKVYVQRNSKVPALVGTINALTGWQAPLLFTFTKVHSHFPT